MNSNLKYKYNKIPYYLKVSEVCKKLKLGERKVRQLARDNKLDNIEICGNVFIPYHAVDLHCDCPQCVNKRLAAAILEELRAKAGKHVAYEN